MVVQERGRGNLQIRIGEWPACTLQGARTWPYTRAAGTSYESPLTAGRTRFSMFARWRATAGEPNAPLYSSPTTTALVNCSSRGMAESQRT